MAPRRGPYAERLPPPKALLFDIGGVCVASPLQAILDYELARSIPPGYINHTIQATAPNGSWQRIERGEIPLDETFFSLFQSEIENPKRWKSYWQKLLADPGRRRGIGLPERFGHGSYVGNIDIPPVPKVNAKEMFWNMMKTGRTPDSYMFPALQKLKASNQFIIAALSNSIHFPVGVKDDKGEVFDSGIHLKTWGAKEFGSPEAQGGVGEEREDIRKHFDLYISSAHVGMRKPEKRMYEYALKELQRMARERGFDLKPNDILFLDDIGTNLKAARGLGMRTIKVQLGKVKDAVVELQAQAGMKLLDDEQPKSRL